MNAYPLNVEPMNGSATYNCVGAVLIALQAEGESYSTVQGAGDTTIAWSIEGEAMTAQQATGSVSMSLSGSGALQGTTQGEGQAQIELSSSGRPQRAVRGAGVAPIVIDGTYRIPSSIPVPEAYEEAPGSRTIAVLSDNRVIDVPIERYAQVRPVLRVERIQPEARTA